MAERGFGFGRDRTYEKGDVEFVFATSLRLGIQTGRQGGEAQLLQVRTARHRAPDAGLAKIDTEIIWLFGIQSEATEPRPTMRANTSSLRSVEPHHRRQIDQNHHSQENLYRP